MSKKKKNMSSQEAEILARKEELKYDTDILGPGSALTQVSHINASRLIMINNQLGQFVNIRDPEPPLVPTGLENKLAEYSALNEISDGDYEIVYKVVKNQYSYTLIGFDKKRNVWHAWERSELEEQFEGFATRYKNSKTDSLEIGDVIKKGEFITKTESYDKSGNYCMGKNLNVVWIISTLVMEDGFALMNGAEKKMQTYRCFRVQVPFNDNEVFLNLYGDKTTYKPFPNIGEKIKRGILCAVRTNDNSKAPFSLKDRALRFIDEGSDRVYNVTGRLIDIIVKYNKDRSQLIDSKTNQAINDAYIEQQDYYKKLYKIMNEIIVHADDMGYTYTDQFSLICANAWDFVDSSAFFSDFNDSVFGNMSIEFVVMDEEPIMPGTKLVGRFGNKGIVSKILPPEKSWVMEDGTPIHVIASALGIVGRVSQSQMNEHSINELSATAVRHMKELDDPDDKIKIVYKLMEYLNSDETKALKKYFKTLTFKEKEKFCRKIEDNGIIIVQEPVNNANILDIENAYKTFKPNWQKIVFPDGTKSLRKVLCAKMYFIRLKQDPRDKYSARGRGPINSLHGMPNKSNRRKKYLDQFSDTPVRLGTAEIDCLNVNNEPEANADFMAEHSTSVSAKEQLSMRFTNDPTEDFEIEIDNNTSKRNADILAAHIMILGSQLEFEYYDDDTDEDMNDDDIPFPTLGMNDFK